MPDIGTGSNQQLGDPTVMNPFVVSADPWTPGFLSFGNNWSGIDPNGWVNNQDGGGMVGEIAPGNGATNTYTGTGIYRGDDPFSKALNEENNRRSAAGQPLLTPEERNALIDRVAQQTYNPNPSGLAFDPAHGSLGPNNQTTYPVGAGQMGMPIPVPGINWPTAIAGTILLNQTGVLGNGGSGNAGQSSSGSSGGSTPGTTDGGTTTVPIFPAGSGPTQVAGAGMGPNEATGPQTQTIYPAGQGPSTITGEGMGPKQTYPIYPAGTGPTQVTGEGMGPKQTNPVVPGTSVGMPETKLPGQTNTPLAPVTGGGTGSTSTGGGATVNPSPFIMPTLPTANYQSVPITPADRNFYKEGLQSTNDLNALYGSMGMLYGRAADLYGSQDLSRYTNMLGGVTQANQQLTGAANQQTTASNNALRLGNLQDATFMGGAQLDLLKQYNPEMYAQLAQQRNAASEGIGASQYQQQLGGMLSGGGLQPGTLQTTLEQQAAQGLALGKGLSAEDARAAQQNARAAYAARGLGDSNASMAAEVLNLDSMGRQREAQRQALAQSVDAQGFGQRATGFGQNASLGTSLMNADYARQQQNFGNQNQSLQNQMATSFNPFTSTYQANSQNVGLNQQLFGNTAGMSSGAYGNQFVQNQFNPFNPYAQDIYAGNFNADNARYISANNNNAAIQGAKTAGNNQLLAAGITGFGPSIFNSIFG